jgi:hypothetical protein
LRAPITGVHRLIADPMVPTSMVKAISEQGVEVDIATLED